MKKILTHPFFPIVSLPLILFAPMLLTGKAMFWGTASTQFIPWWDFAWSTMLDGKLPLWNPWVGMGAPLAANYQTGLFYPPYWIYFLIYYLGGVDWMAWSVALIVCGHLIWSGVGTAKLLGKLEVSELGQTVGGLAFSLSGYLVARAGFLSINAAVSWLPWLLFCLWGLLSSSKYSMLKLSACITMLLLAGHAQTAWYSLLLGGIWLIFWSLRIKRQDNWLRNTGNLFLKFGGAGLVAVGISAIQLVPTLEYLLNSQRAGEYGYSQAMTYSFWPWRLITLFIPDLFGSPVQGNYWGYGNYWEDAIYIGLLPILMAIGCLIKSTVGKNYQDGMLGRKNRQSLIWFLGGITLVSFLLALGDNTPIFPFLYRKIPTFNLFQAPTRWSIWGVLSLSLLAGLGIEGISRPIGRRLYFVRLAAAAFVAVAIGSFLAWVFVEGIKPTFFLSTAKAGVMGFLSTLLVLSAPSKGTNGNKKLWGSLVVLLVSIDLGLAGWGLNPGIEKDFYLYQPDDIPKNNGRIWMPADEEYELKYDILFRFDTFYPEVDWGWMQEAPLPNMAILQKFEMVNNFDPMLPGSYQNWMEAINSGDPSQEILEMMDVGVIVRASPFGFEREYLELPSENNVRIVGCQNLSDSGEDSLDAIMREGDSFLNNVVIQARQESSCEKDATGILNIEAREIGYLKVSVELANDSWLFWSQTWYPGWKAYIDGKNRVEVARANYLFQAVYVPAGEHLVEFTYKPVSYLWGAAGTLASLIVFAVLFIAEWKKEKYGSG